MTGLLAPLAGKTIACSVYGATGYAMVNASGYPFTRAVTSWPSAADTGWVAGYAATASMIVGYRLSVLWNAAGTPNLSVNSWDGATPGSVGGVCSTSWPMI